MGIIVWETRFLQRRRWIHPAPSSRPIGGHQARCKSNGLTKYIGITQNIYGSGFTAANETRIFSRSILFRKLHDHCFSIDFSTAIFSRWWLIPIFRRSVYWFIKWFYRIESSVYWCMRSLLLMHLLTKCVNRCLEIRLSRFVPKHIVSPYTCDLSEVRSTYFVSLSVLSWICITTLGVLVD